MGIHERREREKRQRYNDIIDAAEEVFFEKGLDAATMDDVAEKAELSKGTLYLYFKSKEELYLGIALRAIEKLTDMFKAAVASEQTGLKQVRAIGQAYCEFSRKYPDYYNTMIYFDSSEQESIDPESLAAACTNSGFDTHKILQDAIENGIADGSIRSDLDPVKTGYLLWGQSLGIIMLIAKKGKMIRQNAPFDPEAMFNDFLDFAENSLRPR